MPKTYTVLGLINLGNGELLIAGVLEGEHDCVDSEATSGRGYQRWADAVDADDPEEAEAKVLAAFYRDEYEGDTDAD